MVQRHTSTVGAQAQEFTGVERYTKYRTIKKGGGGNTQALISFFVGIFTVLLVEIKVIYRKQVWHLELWPNDIYFELENRSSNIFIA